MKKTITTITLIGVMLTGCSQQEAQLANTLASSAVNTVGTPNSSVSNIKMLASPASVGMMQSQVIGAQMLMNPTVLGVSAVSGAISQKNMRQNTKAFGDMSDMYVNSDRTNSKMEGMMVQAYNRKYGTKYKTMNQIQEVTKIQGYNEKYSTKYTTLSQVRVDYNKRKGTQFKTDNEFRAYIAK